MLSKIKNLYHYLIPQVADVFYGRPGKKMIVVGVTGTKGKSTTCRLIASVLQAGGFKVGLMSTVEFQIGTERVLNDKKMSMLGRGQIQKMLAQMAKAGCEYAVVETSSEGILQHRHLGIHYDISVFTNLGTEHSERHGGFDNLKKDKAKLFSALTKDNNKIIAGKRVQKVIVANADDKHAEYFLNFPVDKKVTYGLVKSANVQGKISSTSALGTDFTVNDKNYHLNLAGEFNVPNALAAIAVGQSQGLNEKEIADGLASVKMLEGRMEFIDEGQNFKVLVDYAHEPLSLTALFTAMRGMTEPGGKVIGVVGSDGGGRDIGKRGKMGEIAGQLCDFVVITDVNCFDEDPVEIAEMLAVGARRSGKIDGQNLFIIVDRRAGIKKAVELAGPGDVLAITAKGTEPVICVAGGKKIPWDDRTVAREILKEKFKQ
ncbi:MAG: UDP-N-acetylmuramoyl-L-alanyl-D-glutamate--2,6-diaminopimelate ligase [bacterium]|nr:UDP-N-acetylmuramoyl-L-alanyl-D-glutamate--2,6-diaminopimelate ligase [bacterium]